MFLKHNMQPVPGTNHTSEVDLCFIPVKKQRIGYGMKC